VRGKLDHLVETGITAIELMPVAQFSGQRGWGYDGVLPYAPHVAYGGPDALKQLIDAAHERELMVLLDVVYNHFGPDGNYLHLYAPDFFHADRQTPWGAALAYERRPVRDFFIENALYWL
jgi:1,4-alpha-glucan branching enzyme